MDSSEKQVLSTDEISSDEEETEVQDDSAAGTKRSFECTFCKRGFTNAQALGGHMNIHRKDRANKAKQLVTPNFSSHPNNSTNIQEEYNSMSMAPSSYFVSETSSQPTRLINLHFHPSSEPNPRNQLHAYGFQYDYEFRNPIIRSHQPMNMNNQELRGANLSLQIGSSTHVDNTNDQVIWRGTDKKDHSEVDLELRLGHYPC